MSEPIRRRLVALGALSILAVGACTGGQSTAPSSEPSAAASATSGPSAEPTAEPLFGASIRERGTSIDDPEWVVWDEASCSFVSADAPYPGAYQADLRASGTYPLSVVWTPQDTVNDNVILATTSFENAAEESGTKLRVISNNYPDTAQPIKAANDAVTVEPDVVLSMNVFGDVQPAIFDIYKNACIPAVAFSVPPPSGVPYLTGSWENAGQLDAEYVLTVMEQRNWDVQDTSVLFCINGALGTAAGGPFDAVKAFDAVFAAQAGYSTDRVTYLDCTGGTGAATAETVIASVRDWLTAHPDVTQIVAFGGPDANGYGMYNAVVEAGRGDQTILTGIALTKPVRALLLANDPTYVGSVDFGLFYFGHYGIAIAQDVVSGLPIPSRIALDLRVVDASLIQDVLNERGTTE